MMAPDEVAAALKAISKALDGSPTGETVYGCQILLESLAAAQVAS
jgi:hypothetical protein